MGKRCELFIGIRTAETMSFPLYQLNSCKIGASPHKQALCALLFL